jgi:hypothetical protein
MLLGVGAGGEAALSWPFEVDWSNQLPGLLERFLAAR